MSDDITKLDTAQRIVEAMSRTGEPRPTTNGEFNPDKDTVIGEVPEQLRHLHNLVDEIRAEAIAAEKNARRLTDRHNAVKKVFFDSLETHVPHDEGDFSGIKLCTAWRVAGVRHEEGDDGVPHELHELFGAIGRRG